MTPQLCFLLLFVAMIVGAFFLSVWKMEGFREACIVMAGLFGGVAVVGAMGVIAFLLCCLFGYCGTECAP